MKYCIAVDQSTASTKAILFTEAGELIDRFAVSHQQIYPSPGWVEHDAEEIYQNTLNAIRGLLSRNEGVADHLFCINITNQRETVVVFDKDTGIPLFNAMVWQCRRGEKICANLLEAGHGPRVQELTGLLIDTYFSASKLKWLVENNPEIRERLRSGTALIGTIDTYLIYRLTGGTVFATDHTNACRTLLYDINSLSWSEELCDLFVIPKSALAEIREPTNQFGETDLEGLLEIPIPICGVMGDSQAALFAQRCFEPGSAKVTFGTGSSVLLNIGDVLRRSGSGVVTTIAWVLNGKPTYAFEGITNFTGGTIEWLKNKLHLFDDAAETETMARQVEDNGGVYLVPAFVGLSAPYWAPKVKAGIVGLSPSSSREHVVRAGLEAIGYRINDVLELMVKEAGLELESINADGGATQNAFLMEFVAGITQKIVRASSQPELSPLGAMYAGAIGLGVYSSLEDLQNLSSHHKVFEPEMDDREREKLLQGWQKAVRQVLVD